MPVVMQSSSKPNHKASRRGYVHLKAPRVLLASCACAHRTRLTVVHYHSQGTAGREARAASLLHCLFQRPSRFPALLPQLLDLRQRIVQGQQSGYPLTVLQHLSAPG